jgi:hypothetical protein
MQRNMGAILRCVALLGALISTLPFGLSLTSVDWKTVQDPKQICCVFHHQVYIVMITPRISNITGNLKLDFDSEDFMAI